MEKNNYVIFGCGGHARSVADVILSNNKDSQIVFLDKNAKDGELIYNFPVLKDVENKQNIIIALGDNLKRKELFDHYKDDIVSIISNDSYIGFEAKIGNGTFIAHNAHLGPSVEMGKCCIINTHSVLDHEVKVGDFTHISVNATVCGKCKIGSNVFIGAGSTVKDGITICDNVTIGAGAVVVKNIEKCGIYIGCPAKHIKEI